MDLIVITDSPTFIANEIYHNLFMHTLDDGHLGCFQLVAVRHRAAVAIHAMVSGAWEHQCLWVTHTEWNSRPCVSLI